MTELQMTLEMERINLVTAIEAFNKKAEILGIKPIVIGVDKTPVTIETIKVNKNECLFNKEFLRISDAVRFLKNMGCSELPNYYFIKDKDIIKIKYGRSSNSGHYEFITINVSLYDCIFLLKSDAEEFITKLGFNEVGDRQYYNGEIIVTLKYKELRYYFE